MSERQQPPPTTPGARRLSEIARHIVKPEGIASTAWPSVRETCATLTVTFDQWQDGAGRLILAKRKDGLYAADIVVISIPRQVVKTFLIGWIIFALCIIHPRLTVIWTAHRFKLARETFDQMRAMALMPSMLPHVDPKKGITTAAGNEAIRFRNRSRILFGARESGFGLGFTKVGVLVLDEAQRLTQTTMDDLVPTTNAAGNPLIILTGTPPRPTDQGEVFTELRKSAISGESEEVLYIELSADPDASIDDPVQLMKANPSVPDRTSMRAVKRMKKALGPGSYRREGLGIWDADEAGGALPSGRWAELKDPDAERGKQVVFGLDVAQDRTAWVAVAWRRADGSSQVMLTNEGQPVPAHRAVDECAAVSKRWRGPVVPPRAFEDDLKAAGVRVRKMGPGEFPAACGAVFDMVTAGTVRHGNQPALNDAVKAARWRSAGTTGERAFQLKDAPEVGPLAAVTRALHGLLNTPPPQPMAALV